MRPEPKNLADLKDVAQIYAPYVRAIAGKIKKSLAPHIEFDDLVEYGMIGLLEAARRFDPNQQAHFMTFAYYRIRGAIYDGLRGMGYMSRTEYAKARFCERANDYLAPQADPEPSPNASTPADEKAATHASVLEHAVAKLTHTVENLATVYLVNLDASDAIERPGEQQLLFEENMDFKESRDIVRQAIAQLNDQEQQLLEMYYYNDMSLQEVAEKLGLSRSWTGRIHNRLIEKLHRILEEEML